MKNDFVHLHLHSQYSLLDGAIKFDELFQEVSKQGMSAVALTDHGNLFGAYDFYKLGKKNNIKPIVGCELYITKDRTKKTPENNKTHHLTVLCMNLRGYENLCSLVSMGHLEGFYRKPRIDRELLFEKSEGLIVLSGCLNSEVCHNILKGKKDDALKIASEYKNVLGDRYFLEIQGTLLKEQIRVNSTLRDIARKLNIPVVATNDCHYLTKDCFDSHDALLCIQTNSLVKEEKRFRFSGNEFYLKSREEMMLAVDNYEESLENSLLIAERCNLEFNQTDYRLPKIDNGKILSNENFESLIEESLDTKASEGLIPNSEISVYKKRIEHEMNIIKNMGFEGYFLVVSDFIKFAKSSNIPVGPGRGSAAGSLIAYLLDITEVDPIRHGLIFERFLNPERISMPDIDIDFCGEGRDEVIKYVTQKYGQDKVAQIGTFGTMSSKAVIKDVGRVLGFNFGDVNKITNLIPSFRGKVYSLDECYKKIKEFKTLINSTPQFAELYKLGVKLENSVRHSSTHAAGVVISDESLDKMIPLYKGSRGETVTQYDMNAVEDLGFVKFDFLGLKTLTVIKKTKEFIRKNSIDIDEKLKRADLNDSKIFNLLSTGLTRGIFQIESSGMKDVLQNLKADKFDDLVALLALYRPGPLDSGMVDDYILRKNGKRNVDYPTPELKEILKETHGLFVYQEQIMQTASILANFSLGDADLLRRAMGKKKASEMLAQKQKFMDGTEKNKIPQKIATDIFDTMEKFAEYSFNKSHSTAYAYITFQTAFLKTYFPCEFMSSLMSSEINLSEKIVSNIRECKEMGIEVLPPNINESGSGFTPLKASIRFGLNAIKNIGTNIVNNIIEIRNELGGFSNLFQFLSLMDSRKMNKKSLESLIMSGALDCFNHSRSTLFDNLDVLLSYVGQRSKSNDTNQETLFSIEETITEPNIIVKEEWSDFDISKNEIETLGYSIKLKPLDIVKDKLSQISYQTIDKIKSYQNKKIVTLAAFITSIEIKTSKRNSSKYALINLEDSTNIMEAIIFSGELERHESKLQVGAPILITGSVERDDESFKLIINSYNEVDSVRLISDISIPVAIKLEKDLNNKETENLKNLFAKFPGTSPIEIFYTYNGLKANISINGITVDNSEEFQEELLETIGPN
ncbi:MAG: DNA polymerase III subunit alpha [Thermodesulfobacteriota bacteirum]|nr:DNA polymerase III subunit alpha [Thermodesulfobacteriota bacterium]